jgi:hypothetical protein
MMAYRLGNTSGALAADKKKDIFSVSKFQAQGRTNLRSSR